MSAKRESNRQRPPMNLSRPGQDQLAKEQLAKEKRALNHSFIMGVGTTVAVGFIAYGAFNSFIPKKNEVSGTWRLTDSGTSGFAMPINAIVTSENRLIVQNPENPEDYVDLGRLNRISENNTLPKSGQITSLGTRNRNRAAQADAKNYINLLNIAQIAHLQEKDTWGAWSDLGVKLESETDFYTYSTTIEKGMPTINSMDLAKIGKPYPGFALQKAIPKQASKPNSKQSGLRTYLGFAYVVFNAKSNQVEQLKLICESTASLKESISTTELNSESSGTSSPTSNPKLNPKFDSQKNVMLCPEGFVNVDLD